MEPASKRVRLGSVAVAVPSAVSVEEAARLLGVSRNTAYAAVHSGAIPSVRLGKRILVPIHKLAELLDGEGSNDRSASA